MAGTARPGRPRLAGLAGAGGARALVVVLVLVGALSMGSLGTAGSAPGRLVSWGFDGFGLASGQTADQFVAVAASSFHSVGVRADGHLVSWGEDIFVPGLGGSGVVLGTPTDGG